MDIIELSREIGKQIQQDDAYIKLQLAQQASDEDKELQELVGEFNLKRISINNEATKKEKDQEKINKLNEELRSCYAKIMGNVNMIKYNDAKQILDTLVGRALAIISQSAQGENPETTDYTADCGGSCSSCAGCH
ncbi:hypothetical protein AGMMS50284_1500 [Clostridia bacterium]|nr:hypothetical protein AGMMS50284_1500 [Clostridia bacterium]